mmetsp:Transcript_18141/g.39418  ORF Transcript_18141/g.39418 Transcript_18141/m.39418 type:complete len:88 (+) Transcript_18141:1307-1570(+)
MCISRKLILLRATDLRAGHEPRREGGAMVLLDIYLVMRGHFCFVLGKFHLFARFAFCTFSLFALGEEIDTKKATDKSTTETCTLVVG